MKIFNSTQNWPSKVNFIDDNNVLLGFDLTQYCCETADWFIADSPMDDSINRDDTPDGTPEDMPGWNFDPSYFREVTAGNFNEGGMAIFRIVNGDKEKFLHIYNSHNGYYSHGFKFSSGESLIMGGAL